MDRLCAVCGHTTHDGQGYCLFCRTPFPAETQEDPEPDLDPEFEIVVDEDIEPEPEPEPAPAPSAVRRKSPSRPEGLIG